MPEICRQPDPGCAVECLRHGIDEGAMITIVGRCTVDYDGRATSELGPGDRHLMLKPDGTALVHTDEGHQPINWQPPGSSHSVRQGDTTVRIESTRQNPSERLTVVFSTIRFLTRFDPDDDRELTLTGTEADLKQRILETPELIENGFVPLATERETAAGAIDIYGEDHNGTTVAIELKRRRVGPDAVGQLDRYVNALDRELHTEASVRGILVAPSITDRAHRLLAEQGLEFVSMEP